MPTDDSLVSASHRPVWRRVLYLAWPVWVQQLLIMTVGLYDQFLAGNNQPDDPSVHVAYQSALTTANYLAWFVSSCTVLVSVGSTALVARFVGAGNREEAIHATNQSITLGLLFGLAAGAIGLLVLHDALRWMRMDGASGEMAERFLVPIIALVVFQVVEQAGIACLNGAGDTRISLWVLGGVAILNIPMAWICFHGIGPWHGFGFEGIAIGTAISHAVGCVAVLIVLARGRAGLQLRLPLMRPDRALMRRLLRISIPASIDTLSIGLCQLWFLALVNQLQGDAPAAHGIAIRWESLGYLSGYAFAAAAATLVGQNLGARRPHEAAHCGWVALGMGCAVMTTMGAIFFVFAPDMFRLFCPYPEQQGVIDAGVPVLRLVAFAMPPLSCIIIFTGALRGAGDTRYPMMLTWIGFLLIRLPLAYWLIFPSVSLGSLGTIPGLGYGLYGAWIAMFADLTIRGGLFLLRFSSGGWKTVKV